MITPPAELVQMDLPLTSGAASTSTLVTVIERQATGCRVLLSDAGGAPASDFHFIGAGGAIPQDFRPHSLGALATYLARHEELTNGVIAAGGLRHGDLTIARAVHLMLRPQSAMGAGEALEQALEISRACSAWQERTAATARMVAAAS